MTIEYIRYDLTTHTGDELVRAYRQAGGHLAAAPQCLGYDLSQCADAPASFILRIHWLSAADHLQGFRKGPHFPPFLAAIQPFIGEIAEMRHYAPTDVAWSR